MSKARDAGVVATVGVDDWRTNEQGERAVRFINNLTLVGDYSSRPMRLRPWQEVPIRQLFGTIRPDGFRQYRKSFWLMGRKSAKTTLAAMVGIYGLIGTGKTGQEVYSCAATRDQAGRLFSTMAQMIRADKYLSKLCTIVDSQKRIVVDKYYNVYRALASDGGANHGLSPSMVICDELAQWGHRGRDLWEAITTGFGARAEPLLLSITTQTNDRRSLCFEEYDYARKVRDGEVIDPTYLPVLYEAGKLDDWNDEEVWRKAMPGLGDFTSIENVRDLHKQAKELASRENAFRQLYLCQLVDQAIRWLPVEHWRRCKVEMPDLRHAVAYGGLDISSVGDLTAYVIAIPDGRDWYVKAWCWIPVDTLERRAKDDPRWREWVKAGHVRLCEGNTIDPHQVTEEVISISKDYDVRGIALDMWQGLGAGRALERAGHRVSVWRPYWGHTTPPCKELERCVLQGRMKHDGHPVLEWCVDNVAVERDNFDNIRPIKPKHDPNVSSNPKIDLVVSMVMAMGLGMSDQGEATYNPFADGVSNIWL